MIFINTFTPLTFKIILMNDNQKDLIRELIFKYDSILLESMKIALFEDLKRLMISNREDKNFLLKDIIYTEELKNYIVREFLKHNSNQVMANLVNDIKSANKY